MSAREFEIIDRFFKPVSTSDSEFVRLGPGDDCALLNVPPGTELSLSTDTLLEGVHFPVDASPALVASRTLAANLSDLAAMGAEPLAFLLAMTLPEANEAWLAGFSARLAELIKQHNIPLVGGNLSRGTLSLTMTVAGYAPTGESIRRSGATAGDAVYVTGTLGDAAQGLALYQQGRRDGYLVDRYALPTPRLAAGSGLRKLATAMIDISDGLVADLGHLARASQVHASVHIEDLPLSPELLAQLDAGAAQRKALAGGDDYELCFTVPPGREADIKALAKELSLPLTRVGEISAGQGVTLLDADGSPISMAVPGYEHF